MDHVIAKHRPEVQKASDCLARMHTEEERVAAVNNEAVGIKVRAGAPLVSYSIDRACLRKGAEATAGDNVQALVCFSVQWWASAGSPRNRRAR